MGSPGTSVGPHIPHPPCGKPGDECRATYPSSTMWGCGATCPSGKSGDECGATCPSGKSGDECGATCPSGKSGDECGTTCPSGKSGDECGTTCPSGKSGDECGATCPSGKSGDECGPTSSINRRRVQWQHEGENGLSSSRQERFQKAEI